MSENTYSVLMSVYYKENAENLRVSIQSMLDQTLPPAEFVLVCDGALGSELEAVIDEFIHRAPEMFEIVRLETNQGLGIALGEGLKHCNNEWIARMDSDDVAASERCQKQMAFACRCRLDVVSAWIEEFDDLSGKTIGIRTVPETHEEAMIYAHKRNPLNHPCVMFRKSMVDLAGGYRHMPYFEDYDLWVRMIQAGARLGSVQEPLLKMRSGNELYNRRGGLQYCGDIIRFMRMMRKTGFLRWGEYVANIAARCAICLLPGGLRRILYRKVLRA